jgi:hypothetical protein
MIFTAIVGIGNVSHPIPRVAFFLSASVATNTLATLLKYSIYQSSIDYTVAAYGPYAASATGGNDFARDFLSGIAALYSTPSTLTHASHNHFVSQSPLSLPVLELLLLLLLSPLPFITSSAVPPVLINTCITSHATAWRRRARPS